MRGTGKKKQKAGECEMSKGNAVLNGETADSSVRRSFFTMEKDAVFMPEKSRRKHFIPEETSEFVEWMIELGIRC